MGIPHYLSGLLEKSLNSTPHKCYLDALALPNLQYTLKFKLPLNLEC